jgi:hypothetical protein
VTAQVGTKVRSLTHHRFGLGSELALDQIGVAAQLQVGLGGADPFAAAHPDNAGGAHVPGDLITAHVMAGSAGGFPQLARPADAVFVLQS